MDTRIGITTSLEKADAGGERQTLRRAYVRAVEDAGGLPVVVPMLDGEAATHAFARLLDGLIVTGGPAVTSGLVSDGLDVTLPEELSENAPARRRSDGWMLDAFDADASDAGARASRRPVLGICYGMQLVNARRGGRLWADVERQRDGALVHSQKRGGRAHSLHLHDGTHLRRLLGRASVEVNTRHLQAVASVGEGLRASATAPDGTVEAVESADGRRLGVQFHPERLGPDFAPLFRHLVEEAHAAVQARRRPALAKAGAQDG